MKKLKSGVVALATLALIDSGSLFAASTVEQKTQVKFGGVLGGVVNLFGGKAMREGITSRTVVKGNRRNSLSGESGELVDLDQQKIYKIDYSDKTYEVVTFEELRKQMEQAIKNAKKDAGESGSGGSSSKRSSDDPELEVDFDIKETGVKQVVNGFNARQVIATATVREKGKTLAESGGGVLTVDIWMAPTIAALKEAEEFELKYAKKLYGGLTATADAQKMAVLIATSPAFAKAMKKFQEKKVNMTGSAVRTLLKFEAVPAAGEAAQAREEQSGESAAVQALGGLLNRARKKATATESSAPSADGRRMLFSSTTEIMKATGTAAASDLAVPTGFKKDS